MASIWQPIIDRIYSSQSLVKAYSIRIGIYRAPIWNWRVLNAEDDDEGKEIFKISDFFFFTYRHFKFWRFGTEVLNAEDDDEGHEPSKISAFFYL